MQQRLSSFFSAAVIATVLFANNASAQLLYSEGKDYTVLDNPLPLKKAGQEEVIEFFSYACGHCANLEPHIVKWAEEKKPENVGFYQIPAVGGKMWTFVAHAKFTAEKLGLGHDFDQKYFDQVHHKGNRRLLGAKDAAIEFMVKEGGADKAAAEKAWDSLQVKSSLKNSDKLWQQAGLDGVPAVIVNGKYIVMLTEYERFFKVIDYLLASTDVPAVEKSTDIKAEAQKTVETAKASVENTTEKAKATAVKVVEKSKEVATETAKKTVEKTSESIEAIKEEVKQ